MKYNMNFEPKYKVDLSPVMWGMQLECGPSSSNYADCEMRGSEDVSLGDGSD